MHAGGDCPFTGTHTPEAGQLRLAPGVDDLATPYQTHRLNAHPTARHPIPTNATFPILHQRASTPARTSGMNSFSSALAAVIIRLQNCGDTLVA